MSFNINQYRAAGLKQGGARPTQFKVSIFPPTPSPTSPQVEFLVTAASLPGFVVQPAIAPYFGAQIKFSGERVYNNWEVEVLNDEDFGIRAMLEKWSNQMNTLISNRLDPTLYPVGYKTSAEVTQFGKDGRTLRTYRFSGLWPVQISPIALSYEAVTQIERFQCEFALDYFEPIDQTSAPETYNPILPDDGSVSGTTGSPVA